MFSIQAKKNANMPHKRMFIVNFKGELYPKIKFVLFERTLRITEKVIFQFLTNDISKNVIYLC